MSRTEGASKATAVRQERAKAKIQGAINVLKLYGTKITVRSVAKEAGISTVTAQKYLKELKANGGLGESPREEQSDGSSSAGRSEASTLNDKKNEYARSRNYLEVAKKVQGAAAFLLK